MQIEGLLDRCMRHLEENYVFSSNFINELLQLSIVGNDFDAEEGKCRDCTQNLKQTEALLHHLAGTTLPQYFLLELWHLTCAFGDIFTFSPSIGIGSGKCKLAIVFLFYTFYLHINHASKFQVEGEPLFAIFSLLPIL